MTVHGCDVGAWINRQRRHTVWENLLPEQRQRLEGLGRAAGPGGGAAGAGGADTGPRST
ncbi:helicase associated domain-containing protein, partial [Streptomyces sp. NPDC058411]|uniref:helicase associated domain-containing protein n=1 Tax=Streptomyces sp. NPDC058411 TaxID=3346485 RepID=UPI00365D5CCF